MPLEVPPDLVVPVAEAARLARGRRVQQQPRRLDRPRREDDHLRARLHRPVVRVEVGHADRAAGRVGGDPRHHRPGDEVAAAGREGAGDQGVVRAVLGVGRAGEADAVLAADTGRPALVGLRVDQQRGRQGLPAERRRAPAQRPALTVGRQGRQGVAAVGGPAARGGVAVTGDADLALGALVVGNEIVVAERPVGQRTARRDAVLAGHAEVRGQEAPRLGAVDDRAAADPGGDVVVAALVRPAQVGPALPVHQHARVAVERRAGVVAVLREAVVAQVVAPLPRERVPAAPFEQQDALPRLGEDARRHPAARARADDDDVVVRHAAPLAPQLGGGTCG